MKMQLTPTEVGILTIVDNKLPGSYPKQVSLDWLFEKYYATYLDQEMTANARESIRARTISLGLKLLAAGVGNITRASKRGSFRKGVYEIDLREPWSVNEKNELLTLASSDAFSDA